MSRNGSGTFSVLNTFIPDTDVSTTDVNANFDDIGDALTGSLATDGQSSMTGQFKGAAGSVSAPGWSWASELGSGWYRAGSGDFRYAVAGADVAKITAAGMAVTGTLTVSGILTATLVDASVANAKLATMATGTIKGNVSGSTASPSDVTIAALATALLAAGITVTPVGAVSAFANSTVPTGWLECNGAAVSRTTYATLFTALGVTYGAGDASTTFNLPDLRGEFIRGWDHGKGTDTGRAIASSQAEDFKSHTHSSPSLYTTQGASLTGSVFAYPVNTSLGVSSATGGTETRPRNIAMMYCIKAS